MYLDKEIDKEKADYIIINRLIRLLSHLDSVMYNAVFDLNKYLKEKKILKFEIKKSLNDIRKRLKNNLKLDHELLSDEENDMWVANDEKFEQLCYNFFRLGEGMFISIPTEHKIDDMVWTMHEGKETLCKVKMLDIQMKVISKSEINDMSCYVLEVLTKDMKPTGLIIKRSEEDVFKSLKLLKDENSKSKS